MDAVLAQQYSLIACLGFCADVSASTAAGDRDSSRSSATAELMESVRQHVTATSLRSSGGSSGALSTPTAGSAAAAASGPQQSSSEHIQYLEELGSGAVSGCGRCREQVLNLNAVKACTMYGYRRCREQELNLNAVEAWTTREGVGGAGNSR